MDARVFFIWYGDGSNGKSVIMRLLKCILGPLYHQCSKGIFMKGSQERVDGPSPDKVALIGIRCATYSEGETADNIDINESFIRMVSGKDEINARALFRAPLTFFPICKLNLLTNYKPDVTGDPAMRERVRYLFLSSRFVDKPTKPNEFPRDEAFIDTLCDNHLSEVFTWMLKGSIEYYKTKSIIATKEFQEKTDEFFRLQDSITSFFEKRLVVTNNLKDYIKRTELFSVYQEYCNNNSQRCRPRSTLWKRLDDLKIINATLDGYDIFRGIRVLSDEKIMFPKKDNNNDELEELNKLYDKTEQQLDKTNEKIKLLENKLFRSNDLIKMQNDMIENTRRTKKAIYDMNDMITKLDKKYADKINKLTERTNEIDMTVASIQNDQMFSDEESDNNSETTDEDNDESDDECKCGWRCENEESHIL
jgi:hypothetical protein